MKKKEKLLTEQEHREMIRELETISSAKMARAFHKKYKAYGHGLYLHQRYPYLPVILMGVALLIQLLAPAIAALIEIVFQ